LSLRLLLGFGGVHLLDAPSLLALELLPLGVRDLDPIRDPARERPLERRPLRVPRERFLQQRQAKVDFATADDGEILLGFGLRWRNYDSIAVVAAAATEYLVDGGGCLGVVEGGDEDGERLEVVHADVQLVLEHARAVVAHDGERLPALVDGLVAHPEVEEGGDEDPDGDPERDEPPGAVPHLAHPVVGEEVRPQRPAGRQLLRQAERRQEDAHPVEAQEAEPGRVALLLHPDPAAAPPACRNGHSPFLFLAGRGARATSPPGRWRCG